MISLAFGIHFVLLKLFQRQEEAHDDTEDDTVTANNAAANQIVKTSNNTEDTVAANNDTTNRVVISNSNNSSNPADIIDKVIDNHINRLTSSDTEDTEEEVCEDLVVKVKAVGLHSKPKLLSEVSRPTNDVDNDVDEVDAVLKQATLAGTFDHTIHGFEEVPYFSDLKTVEFIRHSTTMFIMRGLPGSGKSTIVRYLQHLYPKSVVCSADDYFLRSNGEYRFDMTKLSEAHAQCQNRATENRENHTPVIIIDNTNIQRWEMGFYLRLAQYHYHTFIVEPCTPWRHNAVELSKRNKHGVDADILHQKLQKLQGQKVFPLYYGWFLTKHDSTDIVQMAKDVLGKCVADLKNSDDQNSLHRLKGILEDFVICYTDPKGMLHCTSKFIGSNTGHPYHHRNTVQNSVGKVFNLEITGFVYTGRSISARVNLDSEVYKHEDAIDLYDKSEEVSLWDRYEGHSSKKDQIWTHFRHGCSSHITIKVANDAQLKVSGEDILRMCEMGFHGKGAVSKLGHGQLHSFPDNMFYLQLDRPLSFRTLFHGYFSPARR